MWHVLLSVVSALGRCIPTDHPGPGLGRDTRARSIVYGGPRLHKPFTSSLNYPPVESSPPVGRGWTHRSHVAPHHGTLAEVRYTRRGDVNWVVAGAECVIFPEKRPFVARRGLWCGERQQMVRSQFTRWMRLVSFTRVVSEQPVVTGSTKECGHQGASALLCSACGSRVSRTQTSATESHEVWRRDWLVAWLERHCGVAVIRTPLA